MTDEPGILHGYWPVTKDVVYPDTVAAVGEPDAVGEPYRWALEVQCVDDSDGIIFVGINFYSRARIGAEAERSYNEMLKAAKELGIDELWGGDDSGLRRIDHTNCWYDNKPTDGSFLQ